MTPLRATIKNVFKNIKGLSANMVIGPSEVLKKDYDILIVDEAHRLKQRKNLTSYGSFDNNNEKLGLDKYKGTELEWILLKSKFQILFYDNKQSVRPSDIDSSRFDELENKKVYYLRTQMRVQGGDEYIRFVDDLLSLKIKSKGYNIGKYDLKLYDDVNDMIEDIKALEKDNQLCRNVAGNAWKWASKNMSYKDAVRKNIYDIKIGNYEYIWNTTSKNWITSKSAINEIGCIHTVQGYDLNYTGVIFGNEIKYDSKNKEIYVDRDNFYDDKSKTGVHDMAELKEYILNVYNILLTRGMRGTYIYVCDEKLRNYIKKSMLKIHNSNV